MKGFKQFIMRGNVLDLAVAVVIGAAFGAVVTALVKDLITPLIAAIVGETRFLGNPVRNPREQIPARRLHQCAGLVPADRGGGILLRGSSRQRAHGAVAARRGSARPDHQRMSGVSQHDSNRSKAMRFLYYTYRQRPNRQIDALTADWACTVTSPIGARS